ncbi:MAG: HAMP domain-containing protein [Acidobacteria bacterium]|nr:HAMP domain-containing protein [Acidobacteriota bacterium]
MRLSFRTRLTIRWLVAFGFVLALAHLAVYAGTRAFLRRDLDAQLRTLAGTELASAVDEPDQGVHLHEFPIAADTGRQYADKFVQLIDARGHILIQSPRLGTTSVLIPRETLERALAGLGPLVDVNVNGRPGRMVGLVTQGPERYVIAVGLFTDKLEASLDQLSRLLIGVWLGGLALTAVVGFSLASRALLPIRRITEQAASIATGQFATRLDPQPIDDEIGQMTRLLNQMLDRLHGAIEANRRFASDASHELRGPLTAMLGEIDVTLKRERSADGYREALGLLRERLRVMSRLTEDLMLLVRAQEQQSPPIAEVRLADLMTRVVGRTADAAAAHRVTLSVDVPADLVVYGDANLLARVFDNLVLNGIQYNHESGTVAITARVHSDTREWVADEVRIDVRNSGARIPEDERERVFERFYRLDPSRSRRTGGAGLGLAISREIVHLFKGTIRVGDSADAGTTIEVSLPGGLVTA